MISGCASYPFLPRGMVGLELDPIHKVLDRNDGLLVARHGPDSGTLYSTHAGCVYSFFPFVLSSPSPHFLPLCLSSSPSLFGLCIHGLVLFCLLLIHYLCRSLIIVNAVIHLMHCSCI